MPTYVYACDSCGAQFEQFQSFKDAPLRTCPSCSGDVRRVFQPVGIVFKGSGWYITDSRKSESASVGTDGGAKSEARAETATESKAEAKSETTSSSDSKPTTA
ncbi:MAG TPA: FmdB family zinc ribbon protein [Roseiflexaceae bacterium]|nr:FmdB family zinc ribbon protein [Roseiflexaceae bacterium]